MNDPTPKNILLSWIGETDLKASKGEPKAGIGPVAQSVHERDYDLVVLLSNYPKKKTAEFVKWVEGYTQSPIAPYIVELSSPVNFGEIYEAALDRIRAILKEHGEHTHLTYHISPGTSAMAAVWIILAKTRHAAELIQSSQKFGVQTAIVPFNIYAEHIPELFKRPDRDLLRLTEGLPEKAPEFDAIIHRSAVMKRVIAKARRVAPRDLEVLIEGETGTGKEMLARAIHKASTRADKPFIAVNCGSISKELAESELFGHEKGAFTDAKVAREGHFVAAHGGTLFLDEIGELPQDTQVKLLRVLQEREVVPVGSSKPRKIDVRIIAATNRTLAEEVTAGRFRLDLFYRIAVIILKLPPIRLRAGDLGILIDHALEMISNSSTAEPDWKHKKVTAGARNLLQQHPWPGNMRELMNTLTRAVIWSGGDSITQEDIQDALVDMPAPEKTGDRILGLNVSDGVDLQDIIAKVARHYLKRALDETGGNKSKAADLLGLGSYQTLNNWVEKYAVNK